MTKLKFMPVLLSIVLLLSACGKGATQTQTQQKTIKATLVDARNQAVPGANFIFTNKDTQQQFKTQSDLDGKISFELADASYSLIVKLSDTEVYNAEIIFSNSSILDLGTITGGENFLPWYEDKDGDTFGDWHTAKIASARPIGFSESFSDCNDNNTDINPDTVWFLDKDSDNYPSQDNAITQCQAPANNYIADYKVLAFDCDDNNAQINPGMLEIFGNQVDDDCNDVTADQAAFQVQAMKGQWQYRKLQIGSTENKPDFTFYGQYNFGDKGGISKVFITRSDGKTITDDKSNLIKMNDRGQILFPASKTLLSTLSYREDLIIGIGNEPNSGHSIFSFQRPTNDLSIKDIRGKWRAFGISASSAGGTPGWYYANYDIDQQGWNQYEKYFVNTAVEKGQLWLQAYPRNSSISSNVSNAMNWTVGEHKNTLIGTLTTTGAGAQNNIFEIAVRMGEQYSKSDLTGQWTFYTLSSGDQNKNIKWSRGAITIAEDGSLSLDYQIDDGVPRYPLQTLTIDEQGHLSTADIPGFQGQLSADKSKFVAGFDFNNGNNTLMVGLKRRLYTMDTIRQVSNAAIGTLDNKGGSLTATANDGTQYKLTVPAGALEAGVQKEIKVVPVGKFKRFYRTGNIIAAAHLVPDGLKLLKPATLRITIPGILPQALSSFQYDGYGGDEVGFIGSKRIDDHSLELGILHFSGAGVSDAGPNAQTNPSESYIEQINNEIAKQIAETGGVSMTPEISALADEWLQNLQDGIDGAINSESLRAEISNLSDWFKILGIVSDLPCNVAPVTMDALKTLLESKFNTFVSDLNSQCGLSTDLCERQDLMNELLKWQKLDDLFFSGTNCLNDVTASLPGTFEICNGGLSTDAATIHFSPSSVSLRTGSSATVTPSFYNALGEAVTNNASLNWTHKSNAFSVSANTVHALHIGGGSAQASIDGAQCVKGAIGVDVYPRIDDPSYSGYMVEVINTTHHDIRAQCQDVVRASSYPISFDSFSPTYVKWHSGFLNEVSYGKLYGTSLEVQGLTDNPWASDQIGVNYYLVPRGNKFIGRREWSWLGVYDTFTGTYTGCTGTEDIVIRPRISPTSAR